MSKNKNKDYALINLKGKVLWSDIYPQKDGKYIHSYIIGIEEEYNGKTTKHSFFAKQFGVDKRTSIFEKEEVVKINGFLKVNSYKKDGSDEWVNQTYILINKIDYTE